MRLSVHREDPGYRPDAWKYSVFCDGVELQRIHTADEELGKAWGLTTPLAKNPDNPERMKEAVYEGKIEIRLPSTP